MVFEPSSGFARAGCADSSALPTELFITGSSKKPKVCDANVAAEVNSRVMTPTKPSSASKVSVFGVQSLGSAGIAGPGSEVGAGAGVTGLKVQTADEVVSAVKLKVAPG